VSQDGISEFAFRVSQIGSSLPDSWVPYHDGGTITSELVTQFIVNGKKMTFAEIPDFIEIESFVIEQRFKFNQAGETTPLAIMNTRHSIGRDGKLNFDWRARALTDFNIGRWYGAQFMTNRARCPRLSFDNGNSIHLSTVDDSSAIDIGYTDTSSAAFVGIQSLSRQLYHGAAIDINRQACLSYGKVMTTPPPYPLLMTGRVGDVAKIYWRTANAASMVEGEVIRGSVTMAAVAGISFPNELSGTTISQPLGAIL
jgi:hypothetical protein